MERDCRMGRGHWRGCHSFTGIICDGDGIKADDSRDGGLKMGGTYWYYVCTLAVIVGDCTDIALILVRARWVRRVPQSSRTVHNILPLPPGTASQRA